MSKRRDRYERAIEHGLALSADGSIELSGQQIHDLFDGIDPLWKMEGDRLVCHLSPETDTTLLLPFGVERAVIEATFVFVHRPNVFHVHAHTRALRDNVSLSIYPTKRTLQLTVQMILDGENDRFHPVPELRWEAPVVEHAPSGIGFQAITYNKSAEVVLENVRITLLDSAEGQRFEDSE
jgi:hypothetical protein